MDKKAINIMEVVRNLTVYEAKRWLGVTEKGGNNKGQVVEIFQRTVDGVASGEPWCMAFAQSCVIRASEMVSIAHPGVDQVLLNALFRSEHCVTTWGKTDVLCRSQVPTVGSIAIWKDKNSTNGHTGIVVAVQPDGFFTIEGNTGDGSGIVREGDGVYKKFRTLKGYSNMELLGFIDPWLLKKAPVQA